MIHETFNPESEAIISPDLIYGNKDVIADICIITFSKVCLEYMLAKYDCKKRTEMRSANGEIPVYSMLYNGVEVLFYMAQIGSSGAGNCIEDIYQLTGATKYIMFGSSGCLDAKLVAGRVIIPTEAYRDEGMSYHYAPASDYIKMKNADRVSECFDVLHIPYVMGKTWTTDAIYRETKEHMQARREDGCLTVEMESAGVQAVCDFRGLELYNFLFCGDLLAAEEWDARILGNMEEVDHQVRCFCIALELARMLTENK